MSFYSPMVEVWIAGQVAFGNMTMADAIFTMGDTFEPPVALLKEKLERIETLQASKLPFESQEKSMEANHNNIKKVASKHKFQKDNVEGWTTILKELVLGTFKDQKNERVSNTHNID